MALQNPSILNIKLTATSLLICFMHSFAIWQLSDLFFKRIKADKDKIIEHWCCECDMGPFPSKRSLDGHISKAHKYRSLMNTNGQHNEQSGQKVVFQKMK